MLTKIKNWFRKEKTYITYTMTKTGLTYKINVKDEEYGSFATLLYMISSPTYVYRLIEDTKMTPENKKVVLDTYNLLIATEEKLLKQMGELPMIKPSEVLKSV